eukprot:TRINITY_DN8061_c1_g2_i1.p1 TRINITY_DN8061_c1_g2~~TRINITY_DN8061_c1_g2_i1.p1  ORF type:complete len:398 (+),score=84.16 TRINITY_DN8061_c1_g2_i1:77-1270(+)
MRASWMLLKAQFRKSFTPMRFAVWDYGDSHPPEGTVWSEKLDGIRTTWAHGGRHLITRNGRALEPPLEFEAEIVHFCRELTKVLGNSFRALDGELWAGRGRFQELCSTVLVERAPKAPDKRLEALTRDPLERWAYGESIKHEDVTEVLQLGELKGYKAKSRTDVVAHQQPGGGSRWGIFFMVFDFVPATSQSHMLFSARYEMLKKAAENYMRRRSQDGTVTCGAVRVVEHHSLRNKDVMTLFHDTVTAVANKSGGEVEGLVLRYPTGMYVSDRVKEVRKVKFFQEYECVCVGVQEGDGQFSGMVGSLECEIRGAAGTKLRFFVGTGLTLESRRGLRQASKLYNKFNPSQGGFVGRVLTVRCNSVTNSGKPRFPRFVCWRFDRDADEVLSDCGGMQAV